MPVVSTFDTRRGDQALRRAMFWVRDADNHVFPPSDQSVEGTPGAPNFTGKFDINCCMNPYLIEHEGQWRLYYAGADEKGRRRICMATAPIGDAKNWTRHGPVFDVGPADSFDAAWCVLPHVVRMDNGKWHCYYTANCGKGAGLSAFPGIGVAISDDLVHWEKYEGNPVIKPSYIDGDPDAIGMAGGSVIKVNLPDGGSEWRYYYTGCPTVGDDYFLHQQKTNCLAVSQDGLHWEKRGSVLDRQEDRDYNDVACATPVVWQDDDGLFRMVYSAIGTRWGFYSICYAESDDGIAWRRGEHYGDDLTMGPTGQGWERQMVEYPTVVREGSRRRLFYAGNGYGGNGIGTAVSSPLRALAKHGHCEVTVLAPEADGQWTLRIPEGLSCDEGFFKLHDTHTVDWHGPDAVGMIWHEQHLTADGLDTLRKHSQASKLGADFVAGLHYRTIITPTHDGLSLRFTVCNTGTQTFHNVDVFPCFGFPNDRWQDATLQRTFIVTATGLTPLATTDRGTGDACRTHYRVADRPAKRHFGEWFWGKASGTTAAGGSIIRTRDDGRFSIGIGWERVNEIFQNEDAHHCMHSLGWFDVLEPGQTKTVRGKIVLVDGDAAAALAKLTF